MELLRSCSSLKTIDQVDFWCLQRQDLRNALDSHPSLQNIFVNLDLSHLNKIVELGIFAILDLLQPQGQMIPAVAHYTCSITFPTGDPNKLPILQTLGMQRGMYVHHLRLSYNQQTLDYIRLNAVVFSGLCSLTLMSEDEDLAEEIESLTPFVSFLAPLHPLLTYIDVDYNLDLLLSYQKELLGLDDSPSPVCFSLNLGSARLSNSPDDAVESGRNFVCREAHFVMHAPRNADQFLYALHGIYLYLSTIEVLSLQLDLVGVYGVAVSPVVVREVDAYGVSTRV